MGDPDAVIRGLAEALRAGTSFSDEDSIDDAWRRATDARSMACVVALRCPRERAVSVLVGCARLLDDPVATAALEAILGHLRGEIARDVLLASVSSWPERAAEIDVGIALAQLGELACGSVSPGTCAAATVETTACALSIARVGVADPDAIAAALGEMADILRASVPADEIRAR